MAYFRTFKGDTPSGRTTVSKMLYALGKLHDQYPELVEAWDELILIHEAVANEYLVLEDYQDAAKAYAKASGKSLDEAGVDVVVAVLGSQLFDTKFMTKDDLTARVFYDNIIEVPDLSAVVSVTIPFGENDVLCAENL